MLIKQVHLTQVDPLVELLPGILKQAGLEDLSPEIVAVLDRYKGKAPVGQTYLMVVALGAGEYWGDNRNGDYFLEKDLKANYKEFLNGHIFRQHNNKNPKDKIGDVLAAGYNDKMHRVELIISIHKNLDPEIYARVQAGDLLEVSMGTRVAYDVCSICGHKSKTRDEYCNHLKYQMGEILEDGRKVFAINPDPKFFDCSVVRVAADPTARGLMKVASVLEDFVGKEAELKEAEIEKEVPAEAVIPYELILNTMDDMYLRDEELPKEELQSLREFPLKDIIATATAMGIQLKPREIAYLSPGDFNYASDDYILDTMLPTDYRVDEDILSRLLPFASSRSYHYPFAVLRIGLHRPVTPCPESRLFGHYRSVLPLVMEKQAELISPASILLMAALSKAGFPLLATKSIEKVPSALDMYRSALQDQAHAIVARKARESEKKEEGFTFKTAALGPAFLSAFKNLSFPKSLAIGGLTGHLASALARNANYKKLEQGEPPSVFLDAIGKRPNLLATGLVVGLWPKGRKMVKVLFSK